jgi:ribose 5-phosphate isomerase B
MNIALCADAPYPVNAFIQTFLEEKGHTCILFGAFASNTDVCWAQAGRKAAQAVANGTCQEGVFLCWSGTGISMVANKVSGVRAALCTDTGTAKAARIWNHANVLALSHRLVTNDLATEILEAWLTTPLDQRAEKALEVLQEMDSSKVSP